MAFGYWGEAVLFIMIFVLLIMIPCVGALIMGRRLIHDLGHFPSKTPAIQMSICWKFILLETFSILSLLAFYKIFSQA